MEYNYCHPIGMIVVVDYVDDDCGGEVDDRIPQFSVHLL